MRVRMSVWASVWMLIRVEQIVTAVHQARSQGGKGAVPPPLNPSAPRSIEWSFTKNWTFYGLFVGFKYDAPPVPDLLVGWGGGHQYQ